MPFSHFEKEIIPEQTITTAVFNIPANEMRAYRVKSVLYPAFHILLFLGGLIGIVVGGIIIASYFDLDFSSEFAIFKAIVPAILIAVPFVLLLEKIKTAAYSLESDLLKRHGWDGRSRYRIEAIEDESVEPQEA